MKQKFLIWMLTLCMMLSLAACTGSKDSPESTAEASAVQSESVEEASSAAPEQSGVSDSELDTETETTTDDDHNEEPDAETSTDEEFTPMDVQENSEIELDENEAFVIY